MHEWLWSFCGIILTGENLNTRNETSLNVIQVFPPQNPHWLPWCWTQASTMRSLGLIQGLLHHRLKNISFVTCIKMFLVIYCPKFTLTAPPSGQTLLLVTAFCRTIQKPYQCIPEFVLTYGNLYVRYMHMEGYFLILKWNKSTTTNTVACGGAFFLRQCATRRKVAGSAVSLQFFIDIIFSAALWPWVIRSY